MNICHRADGSCSGEMALCPWQILVSPLGKVNTAFYALSQGWWLVVRRKDLCLWQILVSPLGKVNTAFYALSQGWWLVVRRNGFMSMTNTRIAPGKGQYGFLCFVTGLVARGQAKWLYVYDKYSYRPWERSIRLFMHLTPARQRLQGYSPC